MSDLLSLARDYLERMANPVYGFATNEEYSLRFAQLLLREGFEASLRQEIETLRNRDALTSNGWLWIMRWAASRKIEIPEDTLVALFEEWSSVPGRCAIVQHATDSAKIGPTPGLPRLEEFPNQFLARIMKSVTEADHENVVEDEQRSFERPARSAEDLLVVFLQVGTPVTLAAASTLLRYQWRGHDALFEYLRALAATLDPETRSVWSDRLQVDLSREWVCRVHSLF
jgi:hypothetical protein